ncbi:MAG: hypothetical protein ACC628_06530 [Pirellulaceae bacterium]
MAKYRPIVLAAPGDIANAHGTLVLEPERWLGKRCPLLSLVDIGNGLAIGDWFVVLYRHDCPVCQNVLPHDRPLGGHFAQESSGPRLALVEMPPYAPQSSAPQSLPSGLLHGRLSEGDWFVELPFAVSLVDGVVRSVVRDPAAVAKAIRSEAW